MAKRGVEVRGDSPAEDSDLMKITPLGSGQEVQISQSWSWWNSLVAIAMKLVKFEWKHKDHDLQVGRSCHIVQFKDKKIMLDCGIHPGLTGMDALPFVDMIEADQVRIYILSRNSKLILRSTFCSSLTSTWTTPAPCPGSSRKPPSAANAS